MKRKILNKLLKWKTSSKKRYPVLLLGVRQCGKTHILKEFGNSYYENVVYVNFETNLLIHKEFEKDISPLKIISFLEMFFGVRITAQKTLIIFDEIQSCERAVTSLKYFSENASDFHVIGAGSLLGVAINREKFSFPVGQVEILKMFPMDFEEFLFALGRESYIKKIRECAEYFSPLPEALHEEMLDLYRKYLVTGGMPAVVKEFVQSGTLTGVADFQQKIIDSYSADMAKYAEKSETVKIKACYDSIPAQLAKENRKFQYKIVKRGGTANIFGSALDWLISAGVILKCTHLLEGFLPPLAYIDIPNFKIYMSDCGLLTLKSQMPQQMMLLKDEMTGGFKGSVAENFVAASLVSMGHDLWYWTSGNTAEVDFVIIIEDKLIPIEVKSGSRVRSRSLSVYREKYKPDFSIRLSEKNFGFENGIKSIPLYAVFVLEINPLNPLSQGDLDYTPLSKGVGLELVEMAEGIREIKE